MAGRTERGQRWEIINVNIQSTASVGDAGLDVGRGRRCGPVSTEVGERTGAGLTAARVFGRVALLVGRAHNQARRLRCGLRSQSAWGTETNDGGRTRRCSSGGAFRGGWYSGWMVLEWMPRSCSAFRICAATGMKSCLRDAITCTDATILFSDNCQMCSSCTDNTPSTSRIALRTSSREMVAGTP